MPFYNIGDLSFLFCFFIVVERNSGHYFTNSHHSFGCMKCRHIMIVLCIPLDRAVNSLPKHKSGYWANVAYIVGTRSAEECQEQYNSNQKTNRRPRKRAQKAAATEEPGKI